MKKSSLGLITALVFMTIIVAGLWPFNFRPANRVKWLDRGNGVWFYGRGIILGEDSPVTGGPMSIEMWLRPGHNPDGASSRILTSYDGRDENFIVEQWKSSVIVRNKARGPDGLEIQRVVEAEYVPPANGTRFVTVTSGTGGISIYLDGRPARDNPSRFAAYGGMPQYLVLGNSPAGKHPWTGDLLGLALYNRPLTSAEVSRSFVAWMEKGQPPFSGREAPAALYLFDEHAGEAAHNRMGPGHQLTIPSVFRPLKRTVLAPPWRDFKLNRSYLSDIALNLAGFVPFGFFVGAFLLGVTPFSRRKAFVITVLLGFGLSFSIELLQFYLPTRSSQLSDLICNTLGTVLGITLLSKLRP